MDAQRMTVDDLKPRYLGIVVEAFGLSRLLGDGVQADDLAVDEETPR